MKRKLASGRAEARCEKRGLQHDGRGASAFIHVAWSIVVSLVLIRTASAQPFKNLDFESATLVRAVGDVYPATVQFAAAFPGWTVTIVGALDTNALHDNMALDSAAISIIDTNSIIPPAGAVIDGRYTALLQSGLGYSNGVMFATDTTLSQTGLVPPGTKSLQFKAVEAFDRSGTMAVTLGGQALPLTSLRSGTNYTLYGADVSQWAGQTAQLSFTVFGENPHVNVENLYLDDIQFSTQPVRAAPPAILWASISDTNIVISWTPSGGTLESSPVVGTGATWSPVGTQSPTNVPLVSGARFFRIGP